MTVDSDDILKPVMHVVMNSVLTCTSHMISGKRYISMAWTLFTSDEIISQLLSTGLEGSGFLSAAYLQLLPGASEVKFHSLVVSCNGCVAGASILWHTDAE